jgi:hypothetical protein
LQNPHDPHRFHKDINGGEAPRRAEGWPRLRFGTHETDGLPICLIPQEQSNMTTPSLTRRTAFAGAAALTVVPSVAFAKARTTAIGTLWSEAEALNARLNSFRAEIAAAAENGGISGWMRLGGEANTLGGQRYARLMAILHAKPETQADLAIMARVVLDDEIGNGAKGYAADQFARATLTMAEAVA